LVPQTFFRIEQGRPSDPKLSTLVALATALKMTVGSLADELIREKPAAKPKGKRKGKGDRPDAGS